MFYHVYGPVEGIMYGWAIWARSEIEGMIETSF